MLIINQEIHIIGTPICRGIAIGRPYFLTIKEEIFQEVPLVESKVEEEIVRYQIAVCKGRDDIKKLQTKLQKEHIPDGAAILDAHLQMMHDPMLTSYVEEQIRKKRKNAEHVFDTVIKDCQKKFDAITDPFFKERFKEIQDLSRRILGHLCHGEQETLSEIPRGSIIFSSELTALGTAEVKSGHVAAFITRSGGATSHAAIVAKAKGIPYVSNVDIESMNISLEDTVIVDGRTGKIIINPTSETLLEYNRLSEQLHTHLETLKQKGDVEAETYDGYTIQISANIEMLSEIENLHKYGGSGVGLFRTESAFISSDSFPSEDLQFNLYRQFVEKMRGLPIVIRTFDFGGDKCPPNYQIAHECNPFLGCRAIRLSLSEKNRFKEQLKAILRASAYGDVSIMFPLVSALSELLEAKEVLKQAREELAAKGVMMAPRIPVGCMIEVPSAAMIADILAKECDFLSIGTNDLVQYTLAVDRSNNALSHLYAPTHPSMLRLIRLIVSEANHHRIQVTVCGEVAADPRFAPLLLGLGVHELSVASRYLPIVKNAIRNTSIVSASKLAEEALLLSSAAEVEALITREYRRSVPEDCFYNC